jgi:hypothetical protein
MVATKAGFTQQHAPCGRIGDGETYRPGLRLPGSVMRRMWGRGASVP